METLIDFFEDTAPKDFIDGIHRVFYLTENNFGSITCGFKPEILHNKRDKLLEAIREIDRYMPDFYEDSYEEERAIEMFRIQMDEYLERRCEKDDYRYGIYVVSVLKAHIGL